MCLNETYSKVHVGTHLSGNFLIQNGLEQRDTLSLLLFKFDLEYAISKVQGNHEGLKLSATHLLLVYADYVNLTSNNIDTIKKNIETLIEAIKGIALEMNTEKTKYTLLSRYQMQNKIMT
jgi:hypothetical protein